MTNDATTRMPTPETFGTHTSALIGKKVKMTRAAALPPADVRCVATYVDPAGVPLFVIVTDLGFVATMGGALAMIPPAAVTEVLRSGKPSSALVENAYEVLNVTASLFNEKTGPEGLVKLTRIRIGPVDAARAATLTPTTARLDLSACVPGYPDGRLGVLALRVPNACMAPPPPGRVSSAWMVWPPQEVSR